MPPKFDFKQYAIELVAFGLFIVVLICGFAFYAAVSAR